MILDAAISMAAGLGLFFVGVKGLGTNLGQVAGRSMRLWVARSTGNYALSALIGTISGVLTQSTNAITVILMSLAQADLISLRRARPILAWANIGTAVIVLLAAVDLHLLVYGLLGITGLCFYLDLDRSPRWRPAVSAALAVGLLLLGIGLMHGGSGQFRDLGTLGDFLMPAEHLPFFAVLVGMVLAFVAQSSTAVTVVVITLMTAHLLDFDQAMLAVYGASVGSGFSTLMVSGKSRGASRQLAIFQVIIKVLGVAVLIPLYVAEHYFDVPLIGAGIHYLSGDPGRQIALVYLACQIAAVLAQIVLGTALEPLLDRLAPPLPHESLSKPRYIYDRAVDDPETALTLVDREQGRLFAVLLLYFDLTEFLEDETPISGRAKVSASAQSLARYIDDFLKDLADTGAERSVIEAVGDRQARNTLLVSIHESLSSLAGELEQPFESEAVQSLGEALREGLGALLLTAAEAAHSLDADDVALLRQLTDDRDSMVDRMRRGVIGADQGLSATDHRHLYSITSLFELIVWMLRRYSALLAPQAAPPPET